jgi:hypothetical protein
MEEINTYEGRKERNKKGREGGKREKRKGGRKRGRKHPTNQEFIFQNGNIDAL